MLKTQNRYRDFYNSLLKFIGCFEYFVNLPVNIKEFIHNLSWPQISINIDETKDYPEINDIQESIRHSLNTSCIPVNQEKLPISNVFGLHALNAAFGGICLDTNNFLNETTRKEKAISAREKRFSNKNKQVLISALNNSQIIFEELNKALEIINPKYMEHLASVAAAEVLGHFSLQEKSLYPTFSAGENKGKRYPIINVKYFNPIEATLTIDGNSRKAYKCYGYDFSGLKPIFISENTIDNKNSLPVYIQEHAVNRMIERLGISPLGYIFDCLGRSLMNPIVVGKSGPSYLLEFNYYSNKFGYLLISSEKDFAVIRSFKFITMSGTPEFYNLKKALRGSREDFEYLGLDSLEILLNSDISKDTKLKKIFEDCGLGHLFKISNLKFAKPESNIAEEIKQYFRL